MDKISEFVEWYSVKNPLNAQDDDLEDPSNGDPMAALGNGAAGGNRAGQKVGTGQSDKKTVLDLCAHMFHPKESSHDVSGTMEYNELK